MKATRWIVTAPWYDSFNGWAAGPRSLKRDAIAEFMDSLPSFEAGKTWKQKRREGWRTTKCTVTWSRDLTAGKPARGRD